MGPDHALVSAVLFLAGTGGRDSRAPAEQPAVSPRKNNLPLLPSYRMARFFFNELEGKRRREKSFLKKKKKREIQLFIIR